MSNDLQVIKNKKIKFGRNYVLKYTIPIVKDDGSLDTTNAEVITIKYPLKLEFDINRNTFSSSNQATLRVYNLKESTRNKMFQDQFNILRYVFVDLYAGYGANEGELPLILSGKVMSCYSERRGTEVITSIQVMDNDIIQSYSNHTFAAGTPKNEVVVTLVGDMKNLKPGAITPLEGNIERPLSVADSSFIALRQFTGGSCFIDNGQVHVLHDNEVRGDVGIYKLTSSSGLLGTPRRRDAQVEIDCLFAPEISVGQLVEVDSSTDPTHFNGQYKVCGIHHSGVISGAECGRAQTTLNLFVGNMLPNSNFVITGGNGDTRESIQAVMGNKKKTISLDADVTGIRDVYNYIRKHKQAPRSKLTANIYWSELFFPLDGSIGMNPLLNALSNLYTVATYLQAFRNKYYPSSKIGINSGWRSTQGNAKVGGVSDSQHLYGKAIDFHIKNQNIANVWQNIRKYWKYGYLQYYPQKGFIHCDIRNIGVGITNDK
jgi:hypothetical protein|nr:MAG TPA: tail protein [Caudoviricetes sp.]